MSERILTSTSENAGLTISSGSAAVLQRACACGQHTVGGGECDACHDKRQNPLQRRASTDTVQSSVPPIVHEVLRSPGQPLDAATRAFMEPRFGHDFSQVRIHAGGKASESAQAVGALAYTVGSEVVFGGNQYAPGTVNGNRTLAHELTHVVQQSGSTYGDLQALTIGPSDDGLEVEAAAQSEKVVSGTSAPIARFAPAGRLQRQIPAGAGGPPAPTHTPAPDPDQRLPRTHASSNRGMGNYTSELTSFAAGSTCMLTLRMNLSFDFVDDARSFPTDTNRNPTATPTRTRWSPAEQNHWTSEFVRSVSNRWSYRYPLVPGKADCLWAMAVCNRALARVEVIPVTSGGDAVVHVAHVPSSAYRSRAGSGNAWLTQQDVEPGSNTPGQVTVEHEFGHLLGLDHSNPACQSTAAGPATNTGRDSCYGVTADQVNDIMGKGSIVTPQDYLPFVEEMNYYTTACDWKAEGTAPKPATSSFLSGHAGLAAGGLLGAAGGAVVGGVLGGGALGAVLGGVVGLSGGAAVGAIVDLIAS